MNRGVKISIAPAIWAALLWGIAYVSDQPAVLQYLESHPVTRLVWALTFSVFLLIGLGMLFRWVVSEDK